MWGYGMLDIIEDSDRWINGFDERTSAKAGVLFADKKVQLRHSPRDLANTKFSLQL